MQNTPTFDQFQGLIYSYDRTQGYNCYSLAQHVRSIYNVPPLPDFTPLQPHYPTEQSIPPNFILDLLKEHCEKRSDSAAQHLDLVALRFYGVIALGTVLQVHGDDRFVCFMRRHRDGGGVSAVEGIEKLGRSIESVWFYTNKND